MRGLWGVKDGRTGGEGHRSSAWAFLLDFEFQFAFQIENTTAFQLHAITGQAAKDFASAMRGLKGAERSLAEAVGPVRRQHAVGGTGDGVFGDALCGRKVAAKEIVCAISGGGHDETGAVEAHQLGHVRYELAQGLDAGNDSHVVELVGENFDGTNVEGFEQCAWKCNRVRRASGKIHAVAVPGVADREWSAGGMKDDLLARGLQAFHHDGSTGKRRVAAERHFDSWREPAETVIVAILDEERGFGKIVLGGHG